MTDLIDTKYIQMQSVVEFMATLGFHHYKFPNDAFYSVHRRNDHEGMSKISWEKAIKLHNDYYSDNHGRHYFRYPFDFITPYDYNRAQAAKIVKRAKIQFSRKRGIILQSGVIKLVDPAYYDIFMKDI